MEKVDEEREEEETYLRRTCNCDHKGLILGAGRAEGELVVVGIESKREMIVEGRPRARGGSFG